jgi:hypothetical protein
MKMESGGSRGITLNRSFQILTYSHTGSIIVLNPLPLVMLIKADPQSIDENLE